MTSPKVAVLDICLGNRASRDDLFQQSPEDETTTARGAPIKPKGEFLQVGLQMNVRHGALVGAKNPPLKETSDSMDSWHGNVSRVTGGRQDGLLVDVAALR